MIRLGFLGTGWIGRNRMEALLASGKASAVGVCDPNPNMSIEALKLAPAAQGVGSLLLASSSLTISSLSLARTYRAATPRAFLIARSPEEP